jgi:hypothetical protein
MKQNYLSDCYSFMADGLGEQPTLQSAADLITKLMDVHGSGDDPDQDLILVRGIMRDQYIGGFKTLTDAGAACMGRFDPVRLRDLSPDFDFAGYLREMEAQGKVALMESDDDRQMIIWVFFAGGRMNVSNS